MRQNFYNQPIITYFILRLEHLPFFVVSSVTCHKWPILSIWGPTRHSIKWLQQINQVMILKPGH